MQEQLDDKTVTSPAILTSVAGIAVLFLLCSPFSRNGTFCAPSFSRPHLRASSSQAADVSASIALLGVMRSTLDSV